jgi:hypothetical protein
MADARKPNPVNTGGMTKPEEPPMTIGKNGWVEPQPLQSPPGVALADKLVDQQDAVDQAELALRLAKGTAMQQALKAKKSV